METTVVKKQTPIKENIDSKELHRVLTEVKNGNFSVRMPSDETGMNAKVYNTLNEIIEMNEKMMLNGLFLQQWMNKFRLKLLCFHYRQLLKMKMHLRLHQWMLKRQI